MKTKIAPLLHQTLFLKITFASTNRFHQIELSHLSEEEKIKQLPTRTFARGSKGSHCTNRFQTSLQLEAMFPGMEQKQRTTKSDGATKKATQ